MMEPNAVMHQGHEHYNTDGRNMGDGHGKCQDGDGDLKTGVEAVKEQVQHLVPHSHQHTHHHVEGDGPQTPQHAPVHGTQPNTQTNTQAMPAQNNVYPNLQNIASYNNSSMPGYHHCHCYGHCRGQVPNTVYQNENTLDLGNLTLSGAKLHLPIVNNQYSQSNVCQNHAMHSHSHQTISPPQAQHQNNPVNIHRVPDPISVQVPTQNNQVQESAQQQHVESIIPVREVIEDDQKSVRSTISRQEAQEEHGAPSQEMEQYYEGSYPEFKNKREISSGFTGDSAKNLIYFQTDDFYTQHLGAQSQSKPSRIRDNVSIVRSDAVGGSQSMSNLNPNINISARKDIRVVPLKGVKSMVTCGGEIVGGNQQELEIVTPQQQPPEVETIGDCHSNDAIAKQFEKVESKMKLLSKSRRLMTEQKLSRRNGLE